MTSNDEALASPWIFYVIMVRVFLKNSAIMAQNHMYCQTLLNGLNFRMTDIQWVHC